MVVGSASSILLLTYCRPFGASGSGIKAEFKYLQFKSSLKASHEVWKTWACSVLMHNAVVCMEQTHDPVSVYFDLKPPRVWEYLSTVLDEGH